MLGGNSIAENLGENDCDGMVESAQDTAGKAGKAAGNGVRSGAVV